MLIKLPLPFLLNLTLLLLFSADCTYAAHPLVTEDSGVQSTGKQQIEISTDHYSESNRQSQNASWTYTYGANDQLDLFFAIPMRWSATTGIGDASLGTKYLFSEKDGDSWALKTEMFFPSGSTQKQLSKDSHDLALTLVYSYTNAAWTTHSNLSMTQRNFHQEQASIEQRATQWRVSLATLFAVTPKIQVLADAGLYQANLKSETYVDQHLLTGIIYSPTDDLDLDLGIKYLRHKNSIERQAGIGMAWRF
ncbi:transporter [Undibacterium sp. Ren11W]|uniref:transporter n=1 Tax=Undibacterium sp. Ren11W TaxID=3413045 RepID=UPI003BF1C75E